MAYDCGAGYILRRVCKAVLHREILRREGYEQLEIQKHEVKPHVAHTEPHFHSYFFEGGSKDIFAETRRMHGSTKHTSDQEESDKWKEVLTGNEETVDPAAAYVN